MEVPQNVYNGGWQSRRIGHDNEAQCVVMASYLFGGEGLFMTFFHPKYWSAEESPWTQGKRSCSPAPGGES